MAAAVSPHTLDCEGSGSVLLGLARSANVGRNMQVEAITCIKECGSRHVGGFHVTDRKKAADAA